MKCACFVGLFLLVAIGAEGRPPFLPILKSTFNIPVGSPADKAGCLNCHTAPPVRNVFGKAVEKAMADANADDLTPAILLSIQNLDSDGNGFTNGEKLRGGFLPADPSSHPVKHEPTASSGTASPDIWSKLFPKHSYHPALVHFPIALYVFAVVLEFLGIRRGDDRLRLAAFWNLLGAALSLLVVVPTGLIACFRQGYSLSWGQPVFTHFVFAISATIAIVGTVIWQRKSRPVGVGYWVLLFLGCVLLCVAGYFGGELVY